jgi:hypothetical protein
MGRLLLLDSFDEILFEKLSEATVVVQQLIVCSDFADFPIW